MNTAKIFDQEPGALECRFCKKWVHIDEESRRYPGICNECEIWAGECDNCHEIKKDFAEVSMRWPNGIRLVEMCTDCCKDFHEDPDFGYVDEE